jgi:hypothetical protein
MAGLKFRVLLDSEKDEEIFRDILIQDTDDFESFYNAIIRAFRFEGDQMASFYVSNDHWDKGHEINLMDMTYDDDSIDAPASVMKNAIIKDFLEEPDQKFILVYDFMRMWIFLIELIGYEKEGPIEPKVLMSMGMAPPEDSRAATDNEQLFNGDVPDEEDEFGYNEFEDDLDEDDLSGYDEYEY